MLVAALAVVGCKNDPVCAVGGDVEPTVWFIDQDGDGYGAPDDAIISCVAVADHVENSADCDDESPDVYPGGGPDLCDDVDQDCDGRIDEDGATNKYLDRDGDGFGTGAAVTTCLELEGYATHGDDCDDESEATYPGAEEICDGLDNNCDGTPDEVIRATCFDDTDGDGFGRANTGRPSCDATCAEGTSSLANDCDDTRDDAFPGAPEACDGIDNDCDAATFIDEGTVCFTDSITLADPATGEVYILSYGPLRHIDASDICGALGYHLPWIDNQAEADFLRTFASAYTATTTMWTGVRWNACAATNTFSRVDDGSQPLFCGPLSGFETTGLAGQPGPGVAVLTADGFDVQPVLATELPFFCELDP